MNEEPVVLMVAGYLVLAFLIFIIVMGVAFYK